ncbi:TetR/AcrR family transcriptional regulator [Nonomuraea turcica]|uniref:TetR/AcrR family transcriptional regulator n=1 Tax=Nonomuraea sp. G32 TaxID=3067274 RepID=UPI00273CC081|nr:helix-turn-helix domain-containing protein [Nonomuraea sp. G32]MDP4505318.1 helix-turn-helix domain-containing protein [Nonomuraea sp. G32]
MLGGDGVELLRVKLSVGGHCVLPRLSKVLDVALPPAGRRDRVLEAARALFAEHGYDVQMSEVAKVAWVGVGTLYRKFPTREALIEAVAEHRSA